MRAVWLGTLAVLISGGTAAGQDKKPEVLLKIEGHRGGVSTLTFEPQGTLLATGSGNGVLRLWETKTGLPLFRWDPPKQSGARVNHIGFSANGKLVSASSKNVVMVWDISPPPPPPKIEPIDPDKDPLKKGKLPMVDFGKKEPATRRIPTVFEDSLGTDPIKIGTVTGNGRRCFFATGEGVRTTINSRAFSSDLSADTNDELNGRFTPLAMTALNDVEGELVAMYGVVKGADKTEPALALVGLSDGRIVARGAVRPPLADRYISLGFSNDKKWLVACNGAEVMYWRVPGSQVVAGDPKLIANSPAFTAAAGPNGLVAFASPPEDGKKVKVTITDISGTQPKVVAVYASDIERVSALAFSPDGTVLAVGDDIEGVVQLWSLK